MQNYVFRTPYRSGLVPRLSHGQTMPRSIPFRFAIFAITGLCTVSHFGHAYAQTATAPTRAQGPVYIDVSQPQFDTRLLLPDARALQRPKDSPLPLSGVPLGPMPGQATMDTPSSDPYESTKTFHKIELDSLSQREGPSWLLPSEIDAQRRTDMEDPYYVPTTGATHLVPAIMPFRQRLQQKGFVFSFTYKGEAMANINGGIRRGMDYVHELTLQMNFDLGRMNSNLNGWSVHTLVMNRAGREVSHDRVGDYYVNLMEVYGLSGHVVAHLVDFYAEKKFLQNRMDVTFGRMSLTHVFATSPLICSFMVTCSAPVALKVDPGFAVYPKATWGSRVRFRPTRDTLMQVGAYQVSPLAGNPSGWSWGSEDSTGLMLPIEFTWQPFLTRNRLPGHYMFGYAHDTSRYPDVLGAKPANLVVNANRLHSAPMDMFWFEGDQMIYRRGGRNQMAGGYLMAGYIHNTPHVSSISDEAYGGLSFNSILPNRINDRLGILYSWYHVSHRKELGQMMARDAGLSLGAQVLAPQTDSHVIEAYYAIDAFPGIVVQPEFQYMIRPGETSHIPDAALVGLKVISNL
ncbi:carbohydrate porin [Acetobacter orientalis]|uniref:carbohydrate porin n=1 Tax=Acetobacter orientalis TaxID=146474 RepID=UPI0039E8DAE7